MKPSSNYVSKLRLTNSVLHCNTNNSKNKYCRERDKFWSFLSDRPGSSSLLSCLSNDDARGPNYRIDCTSGKMLSFMSEGNHIRAGGSSPADAIASIYQYHADLLSLEGPCYPDCIRIPNIVATGTFAGPIANLKECGLASGSCKFPGVSLTLSTGSTPVIYPKNNGRNFIIPGLSTPDQAIKTIEELSRYAKPKS